MARGATGLLVLLLCAVGPTRALALVQTSAPAPLQFSENPVRSDQVVVSWPTPTGDSHLEIYTFTGERILTATIAAPANEYDWDLTLGGTRRVVNGGYIVVVSVTGGGPAYRRRLFIDRPAP